MVGVVKEVLRKRKGNDKREGGRKRRKGNEEGKKGKDKERKCARKKREKKRKENTKLSVGAAIPPAIGAAISSEHWVLRTELERH